MNSPVSTAYTETELHVLDQMATAVLYLDESLRIRYLNQAAESVFSISARKAHGLHCDQLLGLPASLLALFRDAQATAQAYSDRQVVLQPPGQEPLQVDCLISPIRRDEVGTVALLIEVNAVDRKSRIAREELMLAQQQQTHTLLRGLAHEIRNPLGGLRGAAQLLERELPDQSLRDYTEVIIREADRLQKLLDRLLGPGTRPDFQTINIHEVLEHVRKIIRAGANPGVEVRSDYDPSIPEFDNDWNHLTQVFLNIAVNALHAIGERGIITFRSRIASNITIGSKRHRLMIEVQIIDDGPGVDAELQELIFYPMVTGRSNGTGLGLSIAQQTINQLGGLIECSSEPQRTVFTVYIPLEQI